LRLPTREKGVWIAATTTPPEAAGRTMIWPRSMFSKKSSRRSTRSSPGRTRPRSTAFQWGASALTQRRSPLQASKAHTRTLSDTNTWSPSTAA
jgi:hypothetical protein